MSNFEIFSEAIKKKFHYEIETLPSEIKDIYYGVYRIYSPLYSL